ncbi:MAG: ATP--guanido phosphotransferase [Clostridia bacterium]|nr:ATP--guanido phosphotransferase [Clostridia bacterium]
MSDTPKFMETTVISTRVRLARNVKGYPFPEKLSPARASEIVSTVGKALSGLDNFTEYDIGKISAEEATLLQEKHLISPALVRRKGGAAAFISSDKEVSVMVNEEDHLREQYILKGFQLYKAYERLSGIDDVLGESVSFAFDSKLGFLTACPSNLGTGLRASVMMFLPGLEKYGKLEKLLPALKKNGLTVRGVFGEGSTAEGYSYQISNERTLGYSEADLLSHMQEVTLNLAELEIRAREKMLSEDKLGYRDACLRAYGALCHCAVLPVSELTEGIVKVRLGAALGFFKVSDINAFNDFVANMRPISFKMGNCPPKATDYECDCHRASIVGKVLPRLVKRAD